MNDTCQQYPTTSRSSMQWFKHYITRDTTFFHLSFCLLWLWGSLIHLLAKEDEDTMGWSIGKHLQGPYIQPKAGANNKVNALNLGALVLQVLPLWLENLFKKLKEKTSIVLINVIYALLKDSTTREVSVYILEMDIFS